MLFCRVIHHACAVQFLVLAQLNRTELAVQLAVCADQLLQTAGRHKIQLEDDVTCLPLHAQQVSRQGVFDVGLVAPAHLQPFFRSCSFDLDREESVPMAMRASWYKEADEINAQLQANPALQKLLHTVMDDEQRLFTRLVRRS